MADAKYLVAKVQPPALPVAEAGPLKQFLDTLNNVLRLFFNRVAGSVNLLTGNNGGRFLDKPNGLFWDNADQALAVVNTAQPIRFNQTYLNNGMYINGATTSQITTTYSGIYNFQFSGVLRSNSASSKTVFIWIRRNGTDVGYTTREYLISGSGGVLEINWNFNIDVQAAGYIQLMWTGNDIDLALDAVVPTSPHPGIPSAVIAVTFVSVLPENLPTPP